MDLKDFKGLKAEKHGDLRSQISSSPRAMAFPSPAAKHTLSNTRESTVQKSNAGL